MDSLSGIAMFLLLVLTVSVIVLIWFLKSHYEWKRKKVPFDRSSLLFGDLGRFILRQEHITGCFQRLYNEFSDARYFLFFNFQSPGVMIRDPELLKLILVKDFDTFPKHTPFTSDEIDPVWCKNLFALQDVETWRRLRATLSPSYTSSKMRMMFKLMNDCARNFSQYYSEKAGTIKLDMKDSLRRYATDIIATTAFGITCDSLRHKDNEFFLMGQEASNFEGFRALKTTVYQLSPFLAKLFDIKIFNDNVSAFFGKIITDNIKLREEKHIIRPDLLHLLMEARKSSGKQEPKESDLDAGFAVTQESETINDTNREFELTTDSIISQALLFFLAGFDTISNVMTFTAAELAIHPHVQDKLFQEIDSLYQKYKENPTYEEILKLKYLDMVISESLRKWPPIIAGDRKSEKPYLLPPAKEGCEAYYLEKGSPVGIPTYSIHRDPQYYPDPDVFDPERFNDENKKDIKPFTFLPFGLGPRTCIGSRFALLEAKILFYHLIANFEIIPTEEFKMPMRLKKGGVQLIIEGGINLAIKKRVR